VNRITFVAAAALVIAGVTARAQDAQTTDRTNIDVAEIRRLPVLAGGRFKPFDSYAREVVIAVTGSEKPKRLMADGSEKRMDPMHVYLEWVFEPGKARKVRQIAAPHAGARKAFAAGRSEKDTSFSYDELQGNAAFEAAIAAVREKPDEEWNETERELMMLRRRVLEFADNAGLSRDWEQFPEELRGGPPMIPPLSAREPGVEYRWGWLPSLALMGHAAEKGDAVVGAWKALRAAWLVSDGGAFTTAARSLRESIAGLGSPEYPPMGKIDREVRYNRVNPFQIAAWCYVLTAFLSIVWLVWREPWFGLVAALPSVIGLGYHAFGSIERTALSEQALIGNLYESLLFVAGGAMIAGLVFEAIFRSRWILLASSLLAWVATRVALDNPLFMPPSIARLRPVLINNFWIHIHVPTIMLSYATLGLAVVMAHVWLIMRLFRPATHPEMRSLSKFVYWIIPPGVILLFAGLILGGIWADASWGRFWGWDPKETWAFLTWLVFVVVIHGRWSGWLRDFGTAMGAVVGGLSLLMTYYGVNFFLSGLHSYAGASTDSVSFPMWLVGWLAFEVALVSAAFVRRHFDLKRSPELEAASEAAPGDDGAVPAPVLRG
jgi:ABC-type transport system involved in cytochrome c biogenesis permease subunit